MKFADPRIETIACVSSSPFLNHYPDWDLRALTECYETVDYISLHHYHSAPPDLPEALLAGYQAFEDYIRTEIALCDFLRTKLRVRKTMMLSLDEYASFFRPRGESHLGKGGRQNAAGFLNLDPGRTYIRHDPDDWSTRRMPPSDGEMLYALAEAGTMLVLLRHADRVKIGCATGGLNSLCRTSREHVWKGANYYPCMDMHRVAGASSMQCAVVCDRYDVPGYAIDDMNQYGGFEGVETVQAAAAFRSETSELTVFVLNADLKEDQLLTLNLKGFEPLKFIEHTELYSDDPDARNTFENPNMIIPKKNRDTSLSKGLLTAKLRKASWNVFRFSVGP